MFPNRGSMKRVIVCRRRRRIINVVAIFVFLLWCLYLYKNKKYRDDKQAFLTYLKSYSQSYNSSRSSHKKGLKAGVSCSRPDIPLWSPNIEQYINIVDPIRCGEEKDWVYTKDGRFFISKKARELHGDITCRYTAYVNDQDEHKTLKSVKNFQNGSQLLSDTFHALCYGNDGTWYDRYHACIAENEVKPSKSDNKYNVFMFGFDSLSRMMLMRLLPKTFSYFTKELHGEVLEGYNIVGDGTPAALMPILTGQQETETKEMRREQPGAVPVDEALTFIWKKFEKKGYVTQWAEDEHKTATFNMRLLGFKHQPVHHYLRTFYLLAQPYFSYYYKYCYGSKPRHQVLIDWLKEGMLTNKGKQFFTFGFFTELSHDNNNPVHQCDDDMVKFLHFMKNEGFLKNTIFILMSDHGARHGTLRATEQGKIEERTPFVGVYLPESFKKRFPEKTKALTLNTMRLTSPFDIHETFIDILGEFQDSTVSYTKGRGSSLFKEIPVNRTCSDVGIEAHWCSCMQWDAISVSDERTVAAVNKVTTVINNMLMKHKTLCHALTVHSIGKAVMYKSTDQMLKFKGSKDIDGRIPIMDDKLSAAVLYIQVTFTTSPGEGLFEATVQQNVKLGQYFITDKDISRLNWYGDASKCIAYKYPKLRPYCVCK